MNQTHLLVTLPDPACAKRVQHVLQVLAPDCEVVCEPHDCSQAAQCRWLKELPAGQLGELQALLREAVAVLEHSRQAFRSAQLATLRRRLADALKDLSDNPQSGKTTL
ncbi:hypothetical protein SAMN05216603_10841 [Pseudomonas benzenivorans]|nr:hypothetical protein [Pseudomonas benzenivorans]SDH32572.1 hypothetical protein SAMN05216603_10841 [Pseudomonas benzenivorans]